MHRSKRVRMGATAPCEDVGGSAVGGGADHDTATSVTDSPPDSTQSLAPPTDAPLTVEVYRWYYERAFPAQWLGRWLSYGGGEAGDGGWRFRQREFSFTVGVDDPRWMRYLSYASAEELRRDLRERAPTKMDIGPVLNAAPRERHRVMAPMEVLERELLFDIDLDAYLDGMSLGGDAEAVRAQMQDDPVAACEQHWLYMEAAVLVLERALREEFGFRHVLWVFSGRRGVHAWVCDARARTLNREARTAIAHYLSVRVSGAAEHLAPHGQLHPFLTESYALLEPLMLRWLEQRPEVLADMAAVDALLRPCIDLDTRQLLLPLLCSSADGGKWAVRERWERAKHVLQRPHGGAGGGRREPRDPTALHRIVFHHLYPRLDVEVTKQTNHLLKAPFCVHPKTGRVCVPFRAADVQRFRPTHDAPHVQALLAGDRHAQRLLKRQVDVLAAFVSEMERQP
ncbi:hypothetical protein CDCA_CDCA05G1567 [Cyanidium caldarium]|uniref:DNA primase n=1 Tax=Cyanidium caldarium TaxID=2771 RepID=A0AAV9IT95_CYACA|nr:hypothetical protein CDCA_CDCA05G1567 [Cyanidium caldarium]